MRAKIFAVLGATLAMCFVAYAGEIAELYKQMNKQEDPVVVTPEDSKRIAEAGSVGITEIGLERTQCYGRCPAYSVVLKSDGTVKYDGEAFVDHIGTRTGMVPVRQFNQLSRFIKESGYMHLKNGYAKKITDMPHVYTSVVMDGKRKVIDNYADSGPITLWAVEQLIDKVVAAAQWNAAPDANEKTTK
jgi:hypothetical protein